MGTYLSQVLVLPGLQELNAPDKEKNKNKNGIMININNTICYE